MRLDHLLSKEEGTFSSGAIQRKGKRSRGCCLLLSYQGVRAPDGSERGKVRVALREKGKIGDRGTGSKRYGLRSKP